MQGDWDHIVVGAGSAGCVMARRLSDAGRRVLLLEAGKRDTYPWIHIPMGYLYCIGNPRTDWGFRTAPEPALGGRALLYPRGKTLGGCSAINGMLYLRGQAADYDGWRQRGLTGWGWDDVLPYFKRSEDYVDGPSEHHATGGPWRVDNQRLHWEVLDDWMAAAEAAGLPRVDDFNTGDNEGVGYFRVNQRSGWRLTTAKAFLRGADRSRLKVVTEAQVLGLAFDGGRVSGVRYRHGGREELAQCAGDLVLSAGAIGSPHILQLSGVGPAEVLQAAGVSVRQDAPGVGRNLQDHLQLRCSWRLQGARTLNTLVQSVWGKARIGLEYALFRSGPMSMAPSQLGAFARSRQGLATADLEYHVQPLSLDAFGQPLHDFPAITASVCHLRPESRGEVVLTSSDPLAAPRIAPNYLSTPGDRRVAVDAIRLTRRIMGQAPLAKYQPEEMAPGAMDETDDALSAAAGRIGTTIFHPVSTVRMGTEDEAPLDAQMRFKTLQGLRVVDASAMPCLTSGNTNAPTIMMAEKGADMMLNHAG